MTQILTPIIDFIEMEFTLKFLLNTETKMLEISYVNEREDFINIQVSKNKIQDLIYELQLIQKEM